ncbi:Uncharacterized protein SCF082_LOCUS52490 [Durusdinium trenchii]|uniref:Uncharacterized protein n=1 Tax=Durusdinium trenchii TaxID=1381693 RepID=A0ABP0SLU9_9DINO
MSNPQPGTASLRTVTERQIFYGDPANAKMLPGGGLIDSTYAYDGSNTSYETELRKGWLMAKITSSGKWVPCKRSDANGTGAASTSFVATNAAAFKEGDTVTIGGNQAFNIGQVQDDDSAASNGTALYVHIDELGAKNVGHLESVTANDADSDFDIGSGGPTVTVEDDDNAATGGLQVYFDEDASDIDSRFLTNNTTNGKDVFVAATDGTFIRIKHDASASSNGVAVHFDDDASDPSERLLFVSPTDTDGVFHTDDTVGLNDSGVTRATGVTVDSVNYSNNTITLDTAVTWADGDAIYGSGDLAGSEIARAVLGEFIDLYDTETRAVRDMNAGNLIYAGEINDEMVLGDLAAVRNATNYLSQITWADQQGL